MKFAGAATALLLGCFLLTAQTAKLVSIPFVGCPSSGYVEKLEAPRGTSEVVAINEQDGKALAYYKSADGLSVVAPRGWHCQGTSGSGGSALFLGPGPIIYTTSGWEGLNGPVIERNDISGENSGRLEIAELVARVFPSYLSIARQVWEATLDSPLPAGPYPTDTLIYRGDTVVEFRTPARTNGLGNFDSWIGKSDLPIAGAAIFLYDSINSPGSFSFSRLVLLSVRLPADLERLTPKIIQYVERKQNVNGSKTSQKR